MNNSAIRVEWNDSNLKEIEDAKKIYMDANKSHRKLTLLDGSPMENFRSYYKGFIIKEVELKSTEFSMRIFDETGDRRLIWNMADQDQVKDASELFNEYVGKGWKAYAVDAEGKRGRRIYEWNYESQELLVDDRSVADKIKNFATKFKGDEAPRKTKREKLSNFTDKFKQVKLLPKTFPG